MRDAACEDCRQMKDVVHQCATCDKWVCYFCFFGKHEGGRCRKPAPQREARTPKKTDARKVVRDLTEGP